MFVCSMLSCVSSVFLVESVSFAKRTASEALKPTLGDTALGSKERRARSNTLKQNIQSRELNSATLFAYLPYWKSGLIGGEVVRPRSSQIGVFD